MEGARGTPELTQGQTITFSCHRTRGELDEKQHFDQACKRLTDAQHVASLSGKELAAWRWKQPGLVHQVEHWREQLQLTLGLEVA